ncbi:MAG: BON domain-containing protein [Verrucomicrobiales bacterium]
MVSDSSAPTSVTRYPGMTYQGGGETMRRDAAGNVIIETPSTVAQFDPAMSSSGSMRGVASGNLNNLDTPDLGASASMDADRSLDSDMDLSASGSAAGHETGASAHASLDSDITAPVDTSVVDIEPADDLHSGSPTWNNDGDNSQSRAAFENATATDEIEEAVGGPASAEVNVGSGSSHATDNHTSIDASADASLDTHDTDTSLHTESSRDIKADSSIRGGSDRVRNVPLREMDTETPRNFSEESKIKADSSIRGGSDRVRGVDLREMDQEPVRSFSDKNRIKADSSVRGASAQARGTDRLWMSGNRPSDVPAGRVTTNEPDWLHKTNPAQGVGASAPSVTGSAFSPQANTQGLANEVKRSLVRENSGTGGILSKEIARNIKVTENNGTIVLSGTVPNERTSRLIEIRAGEVRGVQKVENRLTINRDSLPAERNQEERSIQLDVEQR